MSPENKANEYKNKTEKEVDSILKWNIKKTFNLGFLYNIFNQLKFRKNDKWKKRRARNKG